MWRVSKVQLLILRKVPTSQKRRQILIKEWVYEILIRTLIILLHLLGLWKILRLTHIVLCVIVSVHDFGVCTCKVVVELLSLAD